MSEDTFGKVEKFARIASAKTTKEALAFASAIQEDTSRDLIQCVKELRCSVDRLWESSRRTSKATNVLVVLTATLAVCTVVLVYLTWILANPSQSPVQARSTLRWRAVRPSQSPVSMVLEILR